MMVEIIKCFLIFIATVLIFSSIIDLLEFIVGIIVNRKKGKK